MEFGTKILHGKSVRRFENGATLPPISQVSAFSYDSAEELGKVFANKAPGFAYTRISNPTVDAFERRVCELEGGIAAIACSSGMAAISAALLNILQSGDEVIAGCGLFGGTLDLLNDLKSFGITTKFIPHVEVSEIEKVVTDRTKVIFGELIGNPALDVMDIESVAGFAHSKNIPLFVDSTTATPYLVNPLSLGADVVIHSSSKYINGSGNSISGIIVDGGKFSWNGERYPKLAKFSKFGNLAFSVSLRNDVWRNIGGCLAPMNAYLNVLGLETLELRMQRICDNALAVAETLENKPGLTVNYPALESSPYYELAKKQFGGKGAGIVTVRAGSEERALKLMDSLKYALKATNIGDTKTLVIHPASTIYLHSTDEQKEHAGVYDDTLRISIGIEDTADLVEDFTQAAEGLV